MTWLNQTVFGCLLTISSSLLVPHAAAQVENANPNYAAIKEFGHIERRGDTARIVAGSSRPLDMAALTLSTCLGLSVSSEDPQYHYLGDLLDVTAPQWAAQHPEAHVYAGRPGKVEVTFSVLPDGSPRDTSELLAEIAQQVNEQQPYAFKVHMRTLSDRTFYSFVPTRTRDEKGVLEDAHPYMDTNVIIPEQTSTISRQESLMSDSLSETLGLVFSCCRAIMIGNPSGERSVKYQADGVPAREVLEDLMVSDGTEESYSLRCQPLEKGHKHCFINVHGASNRLDAPSGNCIAAGFKE
jgi:hypothetical protein